MKKNIKKNNTIAFKLSVAFIVAAIIQCFVFAAALTFGGIMKHAEDSQYKSFSEKVENRKVNLEGEMNNMWTNFSQYMENINDGLSLYDAKNKDQSYAEEMLISVAHDIVQVLRNSKTTGVFLILDGENDKNYPSIYIRDTDPNKNSSDNSDLSLMAGPWSVSDSLGIVTSDKWSFNLTLNDENRKFYDNAFKNVSYYEDKKNLGYWSPPFTLTEDDQKVITYSFAVTNENKEPIGVFGIEIAIDYLYKFLPATDLQPMDSYGYIIGIKTDDEIIPCITRGVLQSRIIKADESLSLEKVDEENDIFVLENSTSKNKVYTCVKKMGMYYYNTPFENEQWYLIGLMNGSVLMEFPQKLMRIVFLSMIICILISFIIAVISAKRFTHPIVSLAKAVNKNETGEPNELIKIGLKEIDDLSSSINSYQIRLMEMSKNVSRIIDLANIPFGAFEIKNDSDTVFMTNKLPVLFGFTSDEAEKLSCDKENFMLELKKICKNQWEDKDIFCIYENDKNRWIRVSQTETDSGILGVVIDVSDDVIHTLNTQKAMDTDPLTGIKNRVAYKRMLNFCQNNIDTYSSIGIGVFDLNNLKKVNDTYGHSTGDEYICESVDIINRAFSSCAVFRIGGDEFAVLFIDMKKEEVIERYNIMLEMSDKANVNAKYSVSIAFGYSYYDSNLDKSLEDTFKKADENMYINKKEIKSRLS